MKLRPFDSSMIEDTSMYDHLPYQRDADICNIGSVALCSGNLLKHYRCAFGDTLELTDMDKLAVEKIQEYIEREHFHHAQSRRQRYQKDRGRGE